MSIFLFKDNASSALASGIGTSDTTLTVTATTGSEFAAPGAGQQTAITLEDVSGDIEIVYCTGRTGDTLTIVRAQEGTTARAFSSGTIVENRVTAGTLTQFLQKTGGDTLSGTTTVSGVLALGSGGSIQGGEFTGYVRSGPGVTAGEVYVSGGVAYSGSSQLLTTNNVASQLPSGVDFCRTGMILFWYGLISAIPSGWTICDGTNGTPNLRDQFIVGGDGALPTSGTYNVATGSTTLSSAVNSAYTMTLADLPSHVHPFDYFAGNSSATLIGIPGYSQPGGGLYMTTGSSNGARVSFAGSPNTGAGTNAHTHTITGTAHTHTQSIPYVALFPIMKL